MEGERVRRYERETRWEFCFEKAEPWTRQKGKNRGVYAETPPQPVCLLSVLPEGIVGENGERYQKEGGEIGTKPNFQSEKSRHTLADAART